MEKDKETTDARRARLAQEKDWLIEELQNRNFLLALEVGRLATSGEEAIISLLGRNHRLWDCLEGLACDLVWEGWAGMGWVEGVAPIDGRIRYIGLQIGARPFRLDDNGMSYHHEW